MEDFFCPMPWTSMFYHVDKAAVCCISSKKFDMTPEEFLASDYLQNLRQKFLNGEYDDTCAGCRRLENAGLQSIRKHMIKLYGDRVTIKNAEPALDYMELRASNLCNFQCKMCNAQNSSLLAGSVTEISREKFNEILKLSENLNHLVLTGGEPMLIKHYYELLDHLIEIGKTSINLRIYTNASVYNPIFIEKILKFNTTLHLSIDAIGGTAEIQRVGTHWTTVKENINRFLELPIKIQFHSTLTTIVLSDVHSLASYYTDIVSRYPNCTFNAHTANFPNDISIFKGKQDIIPMVTSIEKALDILPDTLQFKQFREQLVSCKKTLKSRLTPETIKISTSF
jgi:sulfatase maturation enzyme AslB (radical SAM superfamily)